MVFDLSDEQTLTSVVDEWLEEVVIYCDPKKTTILLIGNKADMDEQQLIPTE